MKNWKKGMIAGSIICIAAGFLFIGIGSSMGGWKNIEKINSRYIHFVNVDGALSSEEFHTLVSILDYGEEAIVTASTERFMVIPRLGTISPWASKATDIVHNCGLRKVLRVERGTAMN